MTPDEKSEAEQEYLCGIDGADDDAVTVHVFNRWARVAAVHHMRPAKRMMREHKDEICKLRKRVDEHIIDQKIIYAKIDGGFRVMKWLMIAVNGIGAALVAAVFYVIEKFVI